MQRQTFSIYEASIANATGARSVVTAILERIMCEEVFHSTFDWQTSALAKAGALEALSWFRTSSSFYLAEHLLREFGFQRLAALPAVETLRGSGPVAAPFAIQRAVQSLRAANKVEFGAGELSACFNPA